jgi:phosphohistidine phosphatase SixA
MRLAAALTIPALTLAALAGLAMPAAKADDEAVWALMKIPGHIVLLRHSNAPAAPPDADKVDFKDCTTQRNLDEDGRSQARRIGAAFRAHGIKVNRVVSSQYCRAVETAKLAGIGPIQQLPELNQVYLADIGGMLEARDKGRQLIKSIPRGQLTVVVSHVTNLQAIAGVNLNSGELAVIHVEPSGDLAVDGRIAVP